LALRIEWEPGCRGPQGLEGWRALWRLKEGSLVSAARTSVTERGTLLLDGAAVPVHRKAYAYPGLASRLRGAFRGTLLGRSRARRERDALRVLRSLPGGPPLAPEPVALAERRGWILLRDALLVSRTLAGAAAVEALGPCPGLPAAVGRAVGRIHAAGWADLDLAPRNLLATPHAGGGWEIAKVDSPRLRRVPPGHAARARDLARLLADLGGAWDDAARGAVLAGYAEVAGALPPGLDRALALTAPSHLRRAPRAPGAPGA
jgi:tRNA A-37 threonylcarbamoyl transferase component Bud32